MKRTKCNNNDDDNMVEDKKALGLCSEKEFLVYYTEFF